jgi:hypothetical protein
VFSSLFSQSSHESDEELEVSNVDDIKSKVAAADGPNDEADDLVIVEDSSNSTEVPAPAAETGSVLFSTFGKVTADDLVVEEFSTVEEKSQVKETNVEESRVKESEPHADVDELLEGSEESEPEVSFEEDPVYYEEQEPFDLEADFYSPGAQAQKAAVSKSQATSGSMSTEDPYSLASLPKEDLQSLTNACAILFTVTMAINNSASFDTVGGVLHWHSGDFPYSGKCSSLKKLISQLNIFEELFDDTRMVVNINVMNRPTVPTMFTATNIVMGYVIME